MKHTSTTHPQSPLPSPPESNLQVSAPSVTEAKQDPSARLTAVATAWIAAFTVVLAIVAALTLWQLIRGGADTKASVDASAKQAAAAESFAIALKV